MSSNPVRDNGRTLPRRAVKGASQAPEVLPLRVNRGPSSAAVEGYGHLLIDGTLAHQVGCLLHPICAPPD